MEFTNVISAYTEIGVLGLCAVLMIILFYRSFKKHEDDSIKKDERIDHKDQFTETNYTSMMQMFQDQQKQFLDQQMKQNEMMLNAFVDKVTTHVPSNEENEKITQISNKIDSLLQDILNKANASRVSVVQFHNGGRGINKQSFLKMSMTNEQVRLGVKPFMPEFKDQFRSVLSYFIKEMTENGICCIQDVNDMINIDTGMYEFMQNRGIEAKFGMPVKNDEGYLIGFVCIEFNNKEDVNLDVIKQIFAEKQGVFETLLNFTISK